MVGEDQEVETHADECEQSGLIQQKGLVEGTEVNNLMVQDLLLHQIRVLLSIYPNCLRVA